MSVLGWPGRNGSSLFVRQSNGCMMTLHLFRVEGPMSSITALLDGRHLESSWPRIWRSLDDWHSLNSLFWSCWKGYEPWHALARWGTRGSPGGFIWHWYLVSIVVWSSFSYCIEESDDDDVISFVWRISRVDVLLLPLSRLSVTSTWQLALCAPMTSALTVI